MTFEAQAPHFRIEHCGRASAGYRSRVRRATKVEFAQANESLSIFVAFDEAREDFEKLFHSASALLSDCAGFNMSVSIRTIHS